MASAAVVLNLVPVGNAGNAPDTAPAGRGSVAYDFYISRYEVTNAQYTEFLNTVDPTGANTLALYNANMTSNALGGIDFTAGNPNGSKYSVKTGRASQPVNYVSALDAFRMANWMYNGQGAGNTESGQYNMSLTAPVRTAVNGYFVPNLNEFHKAAYYDPNTASYFDYATSSSTLPGNPIPPSISSIPDPGNSANFKGAANVFAVTQVGGSAVAGVNYLSNVGDYSISFSPYGTFDQNGNVSEWADDLAGTSSRFALGGSYSSTSAATSFGAGANLVAAPQTNESAAIGFRLAVPEPGSGLAFAVASCIAMLRRRALT